jgi:hypothetical protein
VGTSNLDNLNVASNEFYDCKKERSLKDNIGNKVGGGEGAFDQPHDATQLERQNVGIIGNLALSNINHDIEDLQPNVGSIQMSAKVT